jgi:hypothetical protein
MQTDVIANELAIRLFLFGLSAMFVFEGGRSKRPFSYGIWFFAAVFFLAGSFLTPIFSTWPSAVDGLGNLVANPVSWFVMLIGLFFVFRPLWMKRANAPAPTKMEVYDSKLKPEIDRLSGMFDEMRVLLTRTDTANSARATEIVTRLESVEEFLIPLRRQHRKDVAANVVGALRFFATPANDKERELRDPVTYKGISHPMRANLEELGYPTPESAAAEAAAEQEIRGREKYRTLYDDEAPPWSSVAAKLAYHVKKARLEAYAKFIEQKEGVKIDK